MEMENNINSFLAEIIFFFRVGFGSCLIFIFLLLRIKIILMLNVVILVNGINRNVTKKTKCQSLNPQDSSPMLVLDCNGTKIKDELDR